MASKDDGDPSRAEHGVPHFVIAQAEAAIIAEFEDETPIERRRSRISKPDYSQYQTVRRADNPST
jgi:hypothetical protein